MRELSTKGVNAYRSGGLRSLLRAIPPGIQRRIPRGHLAEYRRLRYSFKYSAVGPGVIEVDPDRITHCSKRFSPREYVGTVVGGDWDRSTEKFVDMPKPTGIRERFIHGKEWEETTIFDEDSYLIESIRSGGEQDGCESREELMERYRAMDDLYDSINENGYRREKYGYHVAINIGRDGELLFNRTGWHRLSISKLPGIEVNSIPVRVVVRHEDWQSLRDQVAGCESVDELPDKARQMLDHPDLQDVFKSNETSLRRKEG